VVKYDQRLRYQWYRGTGSSKVLIDGASTDKLVIRDVKDPADFSTYTVRVSALSDDSLFVESSAKLNKQLALGSGSVTGSGGVGTLSSTSFNRWWVFRVSATNALDASAPSRAGYWVLERKQERNASGTLVAVTTGRSAWVWNDSIVPVIWSDSEQQVQDASANSKSEFSVVASRLNEGVDSFTMNGTVETGTNAAWVGAPEVAAGSYDSTGTDSYILEMSWDGDLGSSAQVYGAGEADWTALLDFVKSSLSEYSAAPAGE